jgi:hypothetical protein
MPVPCARCDMPLPRWAGDIGGCPACGSQQTIRLFPAALVQGTAPQTETAQQGEAACFDHPSKRAVSSCQRCGRFVCRLCAIEFRGRLLCPSCFAAPAGREEAVSPDSWRTMYDTVALTIPFALLVIWPLTILSAPSVIALAIMKWRQPISPVRRNRWRFVAGLAVALAEGGLWVWFIIYWMARARARG